MTKTKDNPVRATGGCRVYLLVVYLLVMALCLIGIVLTVIFT